MFAIIRDSICTKSISPTSKNMLENVTAGEVMRIVRAAQFKCSFAFFVLVSTMVHDVVTYHAIIPGNAQCN